MFRVRVLMKGKVIKSFAIYTYLSQIYQLHFLTQKFSNVLHHNIITMLCLLANI